MFTGQYVFAQLMDFLPLHTFRRCVARYPSSYPTKTFSHLDQCLNMAFANTLFKRVYSRGVDKTTGLRCDQTVRLTGVKSRHDYPQYLRYVVFHDEETGKRLGFFTNNFELPALTIAQLYKCRWQVELFFKWIKQHLRIKAFFGTNESAVKTQIWIAISVYVLVAIAKKRLGVEASLYTILQIVSLTLFEKIPLSQLLNDTALENFDGENPTQLTLFS